MSATKIAAILRTYKLSVQDEKELQSQIYSILHNRFPNLKREHIFDAKSTVDFFVDAVAVEVKISGNKRRIFEQCKRYCEQDTVKELLLVTNRSMGFPEQLNGKDCYVLNLGKQWL